MKKYLLSILTVFVITGCDFNDKIYINGENAFCTGRKNSLLCVDNNGQPITGIIRGYYSRDDYNIGVAELRYENGKQNGLQRIYDKNGIVIIESNYKENVLDGVVTEYYSSGNIKSKAKFKNGKREGIAKVYYENGKEKSFMVFKNGKNIMTNAYDENGNLVPSSNNLLKFKINNRNFSISDMLSIL